MKHNQSLNHIHSMRHVHKTREGLGGFALSGGGGNSSDHAHNFFVSGNEVRLKAALLNQMT